MSDGKTNYPKKHKQKQKLRFSDNRNESWSGSYKSETPRSGASRSGSFQSNGGSRSGSFKSNAYHEVVPREEKAKITMFECQTRTQETAFLTTWK